MTNGIGYRVPMRFIVDAVRSGSWLVTGRLKLYIIGLHIAYAISVSWTLFHSINLIHPDGMLLGADFFCFWLAGQLAALGSALTVYDHAAFLQLQMETVPSHYLFYFFYPPHYLAGLIPLGWLPYTVAYSVFMSATFMLASAGLYLIRPDRWTIFAALAAPAFIITVFFGQNAFLTTALLAFGLCYLDDRPILAGLAIGALTVKPQLGLLIPLVLVSGGYWRTLISAVIACGVLIGLTYLVLGAEIFTAYLASVGKAPELLNSQALDWAKMISVYSGVRLAGGDQMSAWVAQGLVACGAAITVGYVCMKSRPSQLKIRNAIIVVCALLVTPYAFIYDFYVISLPVAWLISEGETGGFRSWEVSYLLAIVIAPFAVIPVASAANVPLAPFMLILFAMFLVARWRATLV